MYIYLYNKSSARGNFLKEVGFMFLLCCRSYQKIKITINLRQWNF